MWFGKERVIHALHYSLTPITFPIAILEVNTAVLGGVDDEMWHRVDW